MRKSVIAIIIIVLVVLYMSVFVVKEGERGITLRFGKVLRDDDNKPLVYEPVLRTTDSDGTATCGPLLGTESVNVIRD